MKTKKTPRADLEKKKILFLEIGFVITLCVVLYSFEWGTSETSQFTVVTGTITTETDIIPITRDDPQKPEPKQPEQKPIALEIKIIDDNDPDDSLDGLFKPDDKDPVDPFIHTFTNFDTPEATEVLPYTFVEVKPIYSGGDAALLKFIAENIVYPTDAKENGIDGTVYISFVIGKDGKVSTVTVVKSIHSSLDKEAQRVISLLPDWTPGKQQGIPVPVSFIIPIKFKLY